MVGFQGDFEFMEVGRSHASGRFDITAGSVLGLRADGPATISGDVSGATLEVTRGEDTLGCVEPMDFSFAITSTP